MQCKNGQWMHNWLPRPLCDNNSLNMPVTMAVVTLWMCIMSTQWPIM